MTPAEYGFAVGAGLQQGFSNVLMGLREARAQQDQSLRERAFVEEMRQNNLLFPLKQAQIENQTKAIELQTQIRQQEVDLNNAEMGIVSAISPIAVEMELLSRANPDQLVSYQIPEIKIQHSNPKISEYASVIARDKLMARKNELLEATESFKDRKQIVQTLYSAAKLPSTGYVDKEQLRELARGIEIGADPNILKSGVARTLIPFAQKVVLEASPEYQKQTLELKKFDLERAKVAAGIMKAEGEEAQALLSTPEQQEAARKRKEEVFPVVQAGLGLENLSARGTKSQIKQDGEVVSKVANQEVDLSPLVFKLRQGAEAIRQQADPMEVIEALVPDFLKAKGLADNPKNRQAMRIEILKNYQRELPLPNFYLGPGSDFKPAGQF